MDDNRIVRELNDELAQRADRRFKGRLHQAFLDWYIEAEFGDAKWKFTDDVNDGGIDAVVWRPGDSPAVVIVQSKYSKNFAGSKLGGGAYEDFAETVKAFRHGDEVFDEFLDNVRSELRRTYRHAYEILAKERSWVQRRKAFRLITTHTRRSRSEDGNVPSDSFLYAANILRLYKHFRQAATPKARDLLLGIEDKLTYKDEQRGLTSYFFNAKVSDFRKYLEHNDVARLLARNIRYDLASQVGKRIRSTYEKWPADFWYFHNGITIICDDFVERTKVATLTAPSVINGGQTLYAISSSSRKKSSALVAVKAIVREDPTESPVEDDKWLQNVIKSVNSQNRVHSFELRSNEPEQVLLQNCFREQSIYYERKRGEWREVRNEPRFRNFERIALTKLGQILTTVLQKDGDGVLKVKKGVDPLFDTPHYEQLFPSPSRVKRRFERIYLAYRIWRLLDYLGYPNSAEARRQRHAFWNCLWMMHQGVTASISHTKVTVRSLRRAFDHLESSNADGRSARRVVRGVAKAAWKCWREGKRRDPEKWTPNNFFKSPYGMQRLKRQTFPRVRKPLRRLGVFINSFS